VAGAQTNIDCNSENGVAVPLHMDCCRNITVSVDARLIDDVNELLRPSVNDRVGSNPEVSDGRENVRSWWKSGSRFWVAGGLLLAMNGHLPSLATLHYVRRFDGW
jgi:hypothetical protein